MAQNLTSIQITLILGGILLVVCLFILLVYLVHKAFQRQRTQSELTLRPRPGDEKAFVTAAVQAVIAKLKKRENELNGLLRDAELRAEVSSRTLETIVREFPAGLMVFDREGFLTLANPPARTILGIDPWSRRRYTDILGAASPIAGLVRECLEKGTSRRDQVMDIPTPSGSTQALNIVVSPCHGRRGQREGVVCVVTKRK